MSNEQTTEVISDRLSELGFQLVDIQSKPWILVADQDGFNNSCILLNDISEADEVINLHNKLANDADEIK